MERYFREVLKSTTFDDVKLLGILLDHVAINMVKSMSSEELQNKSEITEARYRRVVVRLIALKFILVDDSNKQHRYFISEYGQMALEHIISNSNIRREEE